MHRRPIPMNSANRIRLHFPALSVSFAVVLTLSSALFAQENVNAPSWSSRPHRPNPSQTFDGKKAIDIDRPTLIFESDQDSSPQTQLQLGGNKSSTETIIDPSLENWWNRDVGRRLIGLESARTIQPDSLVMYALRHSPQIQAISRDPLIREAELREAQSIFDPEVFVRTQFEDRNDPVGNRLTTGGLPFLKDHIWSGEAGFRRKTRTGADVELGQRLGFHNSNSTFFEPQDQGTATLSMNFSQPLLRGAGQTFNRSQIVIAQVNQGIAWEKFSKELQGEILNVVQAYWNLYYRRSLLLQKRRNVERGAAVLEKLEGRAGLDSLPSQISRARSSVQSRRTELANAQRDVRDAETELRRLIGDSDWVGGSHIELLPSESPSYIYLRRSAKDVVQTALDHRPELKEAIQRARVAAVQHNVSKNELLPQLDLIFSTYVSALEGDSGIARAWQKQFNASTPGYAVGLEYALPYGNRRARARKTQRQLQLAKIKDEVNYVIQLVVAEAQVAIRRQESAYETMQAAAVAIEAAQNDLRQQRSRWEAFALVDGDIAEGNSPVTLLDQLLDSQQRLNNAESTFSEAEFAFKVAEVELKQAMGVLLETENIHVEKYIADCMPQLNLGTSGDSHASGWDGSSNWRDESREAPEEFQGN